jgi:hypothetical protein
LALDPLRLRKDTTKAVRGAGRPLSCGHTERGPQ